MKCKICEKEAIKYSRYSKGEFCSKKCACSYSTKEKRIEINKNVSKKLTKEKIEKKCKQCGNIFFVKIKNIKQECCCVRCSSLFREKNDKEYKIRQITAMKNLFKDPEKRIRLREIGRKGGFGKKGLTKGGIFFQSSLEEKCFSFLEDNNIIFESHKVLPESNRICDIYFPDKELWIELDGINREKKKKWLGKDYDSWIEKLDEYKIKNLNYVILYNFTEFIKYCQIVQLVQNTCVTRKGSWARFPL